MKRRHYFEFEDLSWFPDFLRVCMTRYIVLIHRLFGTVDKVVGPLGRLLEETGERRVLDLCSGAGGPMPRVFSKLRESEKFASLEMKLSDLYPNQEFAQELDAAGHGQLTYLLDPVDATSPGNEGGVRTMICSFHHMPTYAAQGILQSAAADRCPLFVYEISDNAQPRWLTFLTLPIGVAMVPLLTPFIRPLTLTQLVFTYLIPVLPLVIAWDGAVSNVRTYTPSDLKELIAGTHSPGYAWEIHELDGKPSKSLLMIGKPE